LGLSLFCRSRVENIAGCDKLHLRPDPAMIQAPIRKATNSARHGSNTRLASLKNSRQNGNSPGRIYTRHRWYDSQLGRFISRDPIGHYGGINLYEYGANNPILRSDPDGLQVEAPPATGEQQVLRGCGKVVKGCLLTQLDSPAPGPADVAGGYQILSGVYDITVGAVRCVMKPAPQNKRKKSCTVRCHVHPTEDGAKCPKYTQATATAKTKGEACRKARFMAVNQVPQGCYPRHCKER
jgi:RHS repeat-associated protein